MLFDQKRLELFRHGEETHCYTMLGAHKENIGSESGYSFAVWVPMAKAVYVTGQFDNWIGENFPMKPIGNSGIWEAFVPGATEGMLYKYRIETQSGEIFYKADPFAF